MKKRFLSILLTLCMVLAVLPMTPVMAMAIPNTAIEKVQALIDALPDVDTITAESRADVEAQLTAIDEAKLSLEDEWDALDFTKYNNAIATLNVLDGMGGAEVPKMLEESTLQGSGTEADPWLLNGKDNFVEEGNSNDHTLPYHKTIFYSRCYYLPTGHYRLVDEISDINIGIAGTVTLDLNGHALTGASSGYAILIGDDSYYGYSGDLTLKDSGEGGTVSSANAGIGVENGSLTMEGGTVFIAPSAENGCCIYVDNGSTATLKGGTVSATGNDTKAISLSHYDSSKADPKLYADGGTVDGLVRSEGIITRSGDNVATATTFNGTIKNGGTIEWGIYNNDVENGCSSYGYSFHGIISGGIFNGTVTSATGKL